jgi:hypothetical protein
LHFNFGISPHLQAISQQKRRNELKKGKIAKENYGFTHFSSFNVISPVEVPISSIAQKIPAQKTDLGIE